jgi:hypothetical protein
VARDAGERPAVKKMLGHVEGSVPLLGLPLRRRERGADRIALTAAATMVGALNRGRVTMCRRRRLGLHVASMADWLRPVLLPVRPTGMGTREGSVSRLPLLLSLLSSSSPTMSSLLSSSFGEEAARRRKPMRPRVLPARHGLRHRAEWSRVVAESGSTRSGPRASFHGETGQGRLGLRRRWWGRMPHVEGRKPRVEGRKSRVRARVVWPTVEGRKSCVRDGEVDETRRGHGDASVDALIVLLRSSIDIYTGICSCLATE